MSSWVSGVRHSLTGTPPGLLNNVILTCLPQFPIGQDDSGGWRLDIVALLAVTGESFIGEHAQALTSSKLCLLPRIMPAPHALLQPRRPASLPQEIAKVAGVYSSVVLDAVGFFANVIHPIDQLRPFDFKVLQIRHSPEMWDSGPHKLTEPQRQHTAKETSTADGRATTTCATLQRDPEPGSGGDPSLAPPPLRRRRTQAIMTNIAEFASNAPTAVGTAGPRARNVVATFSSPLHLLSIFSFFMTIALIAAGVVWKDGTAVLAVVLLSLATSATGFAALWRPLLLDNAQRLTTTAPRGDIVIRTREGAFLVIKCTQEVSRELYAGKVCFAHLTDAPFCQPRSLAHILPLIRTSVCIS